MSATTQPEVVSIAGNFAPPAPADVSEQNAPKRTHSDLELQQAAVNIQKNYRGYRERRQLQGLGLTPSQRWSEVVKEAQFRQVVKPKARSDIKAAKVEATHGEAAATVEETLKPVDGRPSTSGSANRPTSPSRARWQKVGLVARRFAGEDADTSSDEDDTTTLTDAQRAVKLKEKERRRAKRRERAENARAMGLLYWLEAIDTKHRYGSNLQSYHIYWQNQQVTENFFQWLDYGGGKQLDLSDCPREKLEKERVRYLTREERQAYLVKVDKDGKLCWAKNGMKIDTTEKYRDSVQGIVPQNDPARSYSMPTGEAVRKRRDSTSSSSSSSSSDSEDEERADRYVSPEFDGAKGPKKVFHVSPAVILNHLLRKTTKKNTWIFVADISFRLYVGLKQSGTFQHSSFLNGQRVSAAGLIKVKNGKLISLSPLSGHYRPPAEQFRKFLVSLKEEGVDMSGLKVSKSYGIMVGLEAYSNLFHRKNKNKKDHMKDETHPEEVEVHAVARKDPLQPHPDESTQVDGGENSLTSRIKKRLHMVGRPTSKNDVKA